MRETASGLAPKRHSAEALWVKRANQARFLLMVVFVMIGISIPQADLLCEKNIFYRVSSSKKCVYHGLSFDLFCVRNKKAMVILKELFWDIPDNHDDNWYAAANAIRSDCE
jgi:hypothetical protein